jgi:hypothetical protein
MLIINTLATNPAIDQDASCGVELTRNGARDQQQKGRGPARDREDVDDHNFSKVLRHLRNADKAALRLGGQFRTTISEYREFADLVEYFSFMLIRLETEGDVVLGHRPAAVPMQPASNGQSH